MTDFYADDDGLTPCRQCGRRCDGDFCDDVCASNYEFAQEEPDEDAPLFVSEAQAERQAELDRKRPYVAQA